LLDYGEITDSKAFAFNYGGCPRALPKTSTKSSQEILFSPLAKYDFPFVSLVNKVETIADKSSL